MNNVYYLERTVNGSNQISLRTKLLERRIICLDREIDHQTANETSRQIALLAADAPGESITMPAGKVVNFRAGINLKKQIQ